MINVENYYLVGGRLLGDEDNEVRLVEALSEAEAEDVFKQALVEEDRGSGGEAFVIEICESLESALEGRLGKVVVEDDHMLVAKESRVTGTVDIYCEYVVNEQAYKNAVEEEGSEALALSYLVDNNKAVRKDYQITLDEVTFTHEEAVSRN